MYFSSGILAEAQPPIFKSDGFLEQLPCTQYFNLRKLLCQLVQAILDIHQVAYMYLPSIVSLSMTAKKPIIKHVDGFILWITDYNFQ